MGADLYLEPVISLDGINIFDKVKIIKHFSFSSFKKLYKTHGTVVV